MGLVVAATSATVIATPMEVKRHVSSLALMFSKTVYSLQFKGLFTSDFGNLFSCLQFTYMTYLVPNDPVQSSA